MIHPDGVHTFARTLIKRAGTRDHRRTLLTDHRDRRTIFLVDHRVMIDTQYFPSIMTHRLSSFATP
jgi:hypothetical protein